MAGRSNHLIALSCGAAFAFAAAPALAGSYKVLYTFQGGADGAAPLAALIYFGGKLYGTTTKGGAGDMGTVFSVDPKTGAEAVVYSFQGGSDGSSPWASLTAVGNEFYGTTAYGGGTGCGGSGCGTVFSVNPASGVETVVYAFQGGSDGSYPLARLLHDGGALYGTTFFGGGSESCDNGCGSVFSISLQAGVESVLLALSGVGGNEGANPESGLTSVGHKVFGVTPDGGGTTLGVLYAVNTRTGVEKVLHNFGSRHDSASPNTDLISIGGLLYGTAQAGGKRGGGTVFAVSPETGVETIIYSFRGGSDGADPVGSVIDIDGTLYGTTGLGGAYAAGTLFSLDSYTGSETVLHNFGKAGDGYGAESGVINVGGRLYGTAVNGGSTNSNCISSGCGIIFSYKP